MILITGDLHLTSVQADEYRWGVFKQLRNVAKKFGCSKIVIAGDIADKKDRHPSAFVNRIVEEIASLRQHYRVFILAGNHDYIESSEPFFYFLNHLQDVEFIVKAKPIRIGKAKLMLLVPHTRSIKTFKEALVTPSITTKNDLLVMHQTVKGAKAENGQKLDGEITTEDLDSFNGRIVSGDVHVPQTTNGVTYVGAPYPVKFSRIQHRHRVLIIKPNNKMLSVPLKCVKKRTYIVQSLEDIESMQFDRSDQIKAEIGVSLNNPEHNQEWLKTMKAAIQDKAKKEGASLVKIKTIVKKQRKKTKVHKGLSAKTDGGVVKEYSKQSKLPPRTEKVGLEIVTRNEE